MCVTTLIMAYFKAAKRHPREGGIQNSTSIFLDILQELTLIRAAI
jgi:hypothetical protein